MTKREHEELQKAMNKATAHRKKAEECFHRLQELNFKEGTGHRWCSAETNAKDLLSVGKDYMWLYARYVEENAMEEATCEVAKVLSRLGFWKK